MSQIHFEESQLDALKGKVIIVTGMTLCDLGLTKAVPAALERLWLIIFIQRERRLFLGI